MPRRNKYNPYYNPYYNQDRMTLNTVGFAPAVFNPIQFQPIEANYDTLNKAMAEQREIKKEAIEKQNDLDVALGKVESILNPSELPWFNEQKEQMRSELQKYADIGDPTGARNYAIRMASIPVSDTEWLGRVQNSLEYTAKKEELSKMVDSGFINNTTRKYILKQNPYQNKIIRDNNDKAIGFDHWDFDKKPVKDLNINQLFVDAFKSINPDTKVWNRSSNLIDNTGKTTYSRNGKESDLKESHSGQTVKVSPEEILTNAITILKQNPDWKQQLDQLYGGAWEQYLEDNNRLSKLEEGSAEYNSLKYILDKERPMFYDDKIPKMNDTDTASVYFAKMLFNSKEAQALGYSNTSFTDSYIKDKLNGGRGNVVRTEKYSSGANPGEEVILEVFEDGFKRVKGFQ